jgi:hypothetical protein
MKSRIILLSILLVSISSCQINKRVYRHGFSILSGENNKQSEKQKSNQNNVTLEYDTTVAVTTQTENTAARVATDSVNISRSEEPVLCSNNNVFIPACMIGRQVQKNQFVQQSITPFLTKTTSDNPDDEPKPHWASIASFALALALIFALILWWQNFIFFSIMLPAIPTLILGITGLNKTNKNPDKYKNKVFAIIGIAIPVLLIMLNIFLLAIVFLYWG